jgi:8-oxo-dGTP diphosphatase
VTDDKAAVIDTLRQRIRPPRLDDAQAISAMAADWEVAKQTASVPHPYDPIYAKKFVDETSDIKSAARWVVERQSDHVIVGVVGVGGTGYHDLGFWLDRDHWGQGYATEAVTAVADFALDALDVVEIRAGVFIENPASARVLENAGFTEGETERTLAQRGGLRTIRRFRRTQKDQT